MPRTFVVTSLLRAWLGFSALTILGWLMFLAMDRDNPFHSDDPYLVGFLCGAFAAAMGIIYSVAEKILTTRLAISLCYGVIVGAWTCLLFALAEDSREGGQLFSFFAVVSLIAGALSWPLFAFRLPQSLVIALTVGATTLLGMYGFVVLRLASRY
jgi:hypothetical protein